MLKLNQKGDTIIEVAVAMAILGMIIAVAYGISNRAIRIGREARERVRAAQLQQYQAEALRNIRDNYAQGGTNPWGNFVTYIGTRAIHGNPNPAKTNPCGPVGEPTSVDSAHRFWIQPVSTTSAKWAIKSGPTNNNGVLLEPNSIFKQCVVAYLIDQNKMRFDVTVTWPSTSGPENKSVVTTYLENTVTIPAPPPEEP